MYSPETYRPRILDKKIDLYLSAVGALLIEGPKWCGKTTTGEAHSKSEISLADSSNNFSNRKLAQASPDFVLKGELCRLIDEWQEVPQIWDAVRFACDEDNQCGKFILTGSSLASVRKDEIFHSGTGRIASLTLQSMTLYETGDSNGAVSLQDLFDGTVEPMPTGKVEIEELVRYCVRGGWPKSIDTPMAAATITPLQYITKVIEEDFNSLPEVGRKRDIAKVRAVVEALAHFESTNAGLTDYSNYIRENTGISLGRQTVPSYVDGLKKLFVLYDQPAFTLLSNQTGSKILKSVKTRFSDPSLAIAALRYTPESLLRDMDTFSRFFDCLCVHDLKIYAESADATIYHLAEEHGTTADSLIRLNDGRIGCFKHVVASVDIAKAIQQLSRVKKILTNAGKECALLCVVCGMADAVYKKATPDGDDVYIVPLTALKP